ncbi:MAG: GatB/YqeY domain-containing protein [Calditrichia bacterium]
MSLQDRLMQDYKDAMKSGDQLRKETIRGLRSQIRNEEINTGKSLSDQEVLQVLNSAAKKRRESIEQFRAAQRMDRAAEEQKELEVIQGYLPEQMNEDEIASEVDRVIRETGAESSKDMGKVMGRLMPALQGKADGKTVQRLVQQKLSSL